MAASFSSLFAITSLRTIAPAPVSSAPPSALPPAPVSSSPPPAPISSSPPPPLESSPPPAQSSAPPPPLESSPPPAQSPATPQRSTSQPTNPISTAPPSEPSDTNPSPSISSGAIAGIAIAGVLLIALIIGGWYFWRRKKKIAQIPTNILTEDELVRREGDGNKIVLDPHQTAPTTGAYQTQYQEMSGNSLTQELDRSHSYKYAIGGAHELKAEDRPGELPFAGAEEHGPTDEHVGTEETAPSTQTSNTAVQTSQVSPHVEAQRKREVEWLEMEETRMRQRREALLQQSSGKT